MELIATSPHQADFWKNNGWAAEEEIFPGTRIYSVQDVEGDRVYVCVTAVVLALLLFSILVTPLTLFRA